MSGGILLTVAGIWVLAQVLGGDALGRLGISGAETQPGTTDTGPKVVAPGPMTGIPVPGLSFPSTGGGSTTTRI